MLSRRKYFSVTGEGNFPFVLLCQDECYPATLADADKIALACPTVAPSVTIVLATHMEGAPKVHLWAKAKWRVLQVNL